MTIEDVLRRDETFRYMLLDRMRVDCNVYLDNGNRNINRLWAGNEALHIAYMKAIWESFTEKPVWLTMEEICQLEAKMLSNS